jgi:hypothetical protein
MDSSGVIQPGDTHSRPFKYIYEIKFHFNFKLCIYVY